jgi:hypothetical protein
MFRSSDALRAAVPCPADKDGCPQGLESRGTMARPQNTVQALNPFSPPSTSSRLSVCKPRQPTLKNKTGPTNQRLIRPRLRRRRLRRRRLRRQSMAKKKKGRNAIIGLKETSQPLRYHMSATRTLRSGMERI